MESYFGGEEDVNAGQVKGGGEEALEVCVKGSHRKVAGKWPQYCFETDN